MSPLSDCFLRAVLYSHVNTQGHEYFGSQKGVHRTFYEHLTLALHASRYCVAQIRYIVLRLYQHSCKSIVEDTSSVATTWSRTAPPSRRASTLSSKRL